MLDSKELDEMIALISTFDRDTLIAHFHSFPADFPVDFSPEFLQTQPLEELRHIFVALCLHTRRKPTAPFPAAA